MTEASEIAAESLRLEQARSRCPKAEALEGELRELLDRGDIALDGAKRGPLESLLLGVGLMVRDGQEASPEFEAQIREQMARLASSPPQTVGPGIYPGLSFSEYHLIDAVNHSTLEGFVRTPAHAREAMLRPKESSVAQALGHAFHVCLLEPERFDLEYVVPPKFDRRTKVGKAGWAEWELTNPNALLIDKDEADLFRRMRDSVMENATARELLSAGASEFAIVWTDPQTGLLCKGRLDHVGPLAGWTFIVDVKTTRNAAERVFQKDVASYGYHRQLAMYRDGLSVLRPGPERRCAIIAVEKEPPFCTAVHEIDERALEQGSREYHGHLQTYRRCKETGSWPGYDAGLSLIDLPPWAVDRLD